MYKKNPIFSFFSSVKLALFTLCILALTSIIGTIIPQKKSMDWYVQNYSEATAKFFQVLSIPDMYNSWWFLGLLGLLSLNLIACSIDRFPGVWRQVKADNLAIDLKRLPKMRLNANWVSNKSEENLSTALSNKFSSNGWKTKQRSRDDALLLFAQKGALSRTGVYIVHTSILVIFLGAIIGTLYGFKASIMLPETQETSIVFQTGTGKPIELGFTVRCDRFDIEFYDNGMVKTYRSKLIVTENGKVTMEKSIVVNDPLHYRGLTFYQSSYKGYREFLLTITDQESNVAETVILPFQEQKPLTKHNATIGIINAQAMGETITNMKIWFKNDSGPASKFWVDAGDHVTIERDGKKYTIAGKQMYATGLQVAKDPGVWVVYIGCGLMLLGLYMAFFMSHRRIWLLIRKGNDETTVLMSGNTNKNKIGFETTFDALSTKLKTCDIN
jgi:cytochrome c biogenesis protein